MVTHPEPIWIETQGHSALTVGSDDFNIKFRCCSTDHKWHFSGWVRTFSLFGAPFDRSNPRLEDWHPRLAGSVRFTERTFSSHMGCEMEFGQTIIGTPIVIFNAGGKPMLSWHKGRLDLR